MDKIVSANAEHKSAAKAKKRLWKLAEVSVSVPEIMELSGMIGQELCEHLEQQATAHAEQTLKPQHAEPPRLAAVSVDGGRIMTRAEAGRGVHDRAWKETKNACPMTTSSSPSEEDPQPELPPCFSDCRYVEQLVREVHSSTSCPEKSGEIPAISVEDDPWPLYLRATTACWQGRVADFLGELRAWQAAHPAPPDEKLAEDDPRSMVQETVTYLENNQARMDYPAYRCQGLPVSTSMIESLIKEINYRVKGTEKFWNRPKGAEQILQIRAAALCDDDRLSQWILNRPGSHFYRRSTPKEVGLATPA